MGHIPLGAPPFWCLALEEVDELQGLSRMTRCASRCGRTCRGGGHPRGSTHSLSAPVTGASCSSGGQEGKRKPPFRGPCVVLHPIFPAKPPALQKSDKLHEKRAKLKLSKHIVIITTTQFIYFSPPHYLWAKKQPWVLPSLS